MKTSSADRKNSARLLCTSAKMLTLWPEVPDLTLFNAYYRQISNGPIPESSTFPAPQGRPKIAHRFSGGVSDPLTPKSRQGRQNLRHSRFYDLSPTSTGAPSFRRSVRSFI